MIYYCTTALRHIATRLLRWWLHTLFICFGQHSALKTHASCTRGGDESFGREETPLLLVTQPAGLAAWLREGGQNPANIAHKHLGTCGQHGSARPHTGWGPTQSWPAGLLRYAKQMKSCSLETLPSAGTSYPGGQKLLWKLSVRFSSFLSTASVREEFVSWRVYPIQSPMTTHGAW